MPGDETHLWKSWLVGDGPNVSLYTQNYFRYMVFDDPSWNALTANTDAAMHAADTKTAQALNSTDPDLSRFAARGGKLNSVSRLERSSDIASKHRSVLRAGAGEDG